MTANMLSPQNTTQAEKGLLTIAIGEKYSAQAKWLALSCMLHSPQTPRAVITGNAGLLADYYDFVIPYNAALGDPFNTKLKLPYYTPFQKTLYVDADSLVYASLDYYFDVLNDAPVLYHGETLTGGDWYMDIAAVMQKEQLPWLPKFNSGMLLFNLCDKAAAVFNTAYNSLQNSAAYGIDYFRGKMLPDEPFLAIAFAKHGIRPTEDHGRFSYTLINASSVNLNIKKGIARFYKNGRFVRPLIVHFCGRFGAFFYRREKRRLVSYIDNPFSRFISSCSELIRNFVKRSR